MGAEQSPRLKHRRATVVFQVILIAAGVVAVSTGVAGLPGLVSVDGAGSLFLLVFGAIWVYGGIYKADLIDHLI